jgi:hypothetical protein
VSRETGLRFTFEIRCLHFEEDRLTFCIRPEDGPELPDIMKWMKQVFARRFNAVAGRTGVCYTPGKTHSKVRFSSAQTP